MPPTDPDPRTPKWAWLALGSALAWVVLARIPLLLNAEAHLDSDLAVDGLTLIDALNGHWRWHYPGTPHMGTIPVLLSWIQAKVWGANPITLASGGVVAYGLVVLSTFLLSLRVYGPKVAAWGLIPMAFASTGTTWLAGRITGGHLLTVAWHASAFLGLYSCLAKGGFARVAALGLWCGLGLYLDRMFLLSIVALVAAGVGAWMPSGRAFRGMALASVFAASVFVGEMPHRVGVRVDPADSYPEQFEFDPRDGKLGELLRIHAGILAFDCLPRLIAGHRLPGLESEPAPEALARPTVAKGGRDPGFLALATTAITLPIALLAFLFLAWDGLFGRSIGADENQDGARRAVGRGLIFASMLVVAGFVLNKNIFNSDNYRYLVFLLVPWSVGFGLAFERLARRKRGRIAAGASAVLFMGILSADLATWYHRFGWIDDRGIPARRTRPEAALAWFGDHPEIRDVFGGYWDVYRLSFLSGGRIRGVPYPIFPDRFPEWSRDLKGHRPRTMIVRPSREGEYYRASAIAGGGRILWSDGSAMILDWP